MRTPIVPGRHDIGILSIALAAVLHVTSSSSAAASYVNFESQHVHPIALSADGSRLFAVNTPDNSLAVYSVTPQGPVLDFEVPVGIEPTMIVRGKPIALAITVGGLAITEHTLWLGADVRVSSPAPDATPSPGTP